MQIHQLSSIKQKRHRRVGRGGTRGNRSGRGGKGQTARTGARLRPAIRDLIRKIPKLRGVPAGRYKKQGPKQYRTFFAVVDLDQVEKKFSEGDVVNPKTLLQKRIVRRIGGKAPSVKILGGGTITKKLKFEGVEMSKTAQEKTQHVV
ncbi:MAG: uL15 family ribosomal protein [Candidatus Spechtbacteria bacterium]|nr:uL15 family ribosomal protein [Candidatus Spechtbacteria bacterium]